MKDIWAGAQDVRGELVYPRLHARRGSGAGGWAAYMTGTGAALPATTGSRPTTSPVHGVRKSELGFPRRSTTTRTCWSR